MLVFDQLKKDDPQLRLFATVVLAGMLVLLAGLWWVQVVSSRRYVERLENQSIRTVRIPAVRGEILDREGRPLAENHPQYNIDLYLEGLSRDYQVACSNTIAFAKRFLSQQAAARKAQLGRELTPQEKRQFALTRPMMEELNRQTRYQVTSNLVAELGSRLGQTLNLTQKDFEEHYEKFRALPLPILTNIGATEIAKFEEQSLHTPAMDLDVLSVRGYPDGLAAAHLLGYLVRTDVNGDDDPSDRYNYRLKDYSGACGVERLFDGELRGTAGAKSVLVNNLGYWQGETVWSPAEPGANVNLTIDLDIQKAAQESLDSNREDARGAIVVMDVRNGDVLAMASSPGFNPNYFVERPSLDVWAGLSERWTNEDLQVQMNHALQGMYPPGSIFKIVVGMAALEEGLDPHEILHSPGYVPLGGRLNSKMGDLAPAGDYDFDKALAQSCNYYFVTVVTNNPKSRVLSKVVELGKRLHFGERTDVVRHQEEDRGYFPEPADIFARSWFLGNTAHLCIGQEKVAVTPMQVAVMISAVANGGKVFYPRLVSSLTPYGADVPSQTFPGGRLRDMLGVSQRTLQIVHQAMETDVEGPTGTGREAAVAGLDIAGKTGTAEVENAGGHKEKDLGITWFASFAPVGNPKYAVVVMVVGGASGGKTCAPIARNVYVEILRKEQEARTRAGTLAEIKN